MRANALAKAIEGGDAVAADHDATDVFELRAFFALRRCLALDDFQPEHAVRQVRAGDHTDARTKPAVRRRKGGLAVN